MIDHGQQYIDILSAAIPSSGYRPQTEAEWLRLQRAMIEASSHLYRANGVPKSQAKRMARLIHGGAAGRKLLELSFSGPETEEVAQ